MAEKLPFAFEEIPRDAVGEESITPNFTLSESMGAAFDLSQEQTPLGAVNRLLRADAADTGEQQTAEQSNALYPNMTEKFTETMSAGAALNIAKADTERKKLEQRIVNGPDGFWAGAAQFGASLLPHAIDPVNLAADVAVGAAIPVIGAAIPITAQVLRAGKVLRSVKALNASAGFLRRSTTARIALEGTLGNLAVEPLNILANKQEMIDQGVDDIFLNTVGGAVGYAGFRYGVIKGVSGVRLGANRAAEYIGRLSPDHNATVQRLSIVQLGSDRNIRIDPLIKDFVSETDSVRPSKFSPTGRDAYRFDRLDLPSVKTTIFYASTGKKTNNLDKTPTEILGSDYGNATYMSDNAGVANGSAARKLNYADGSVHAFEISPSAKLLDMETKLPDSLATKIKSIVGDKLKLDRPFREVMDDIIEDISLGKRSDETIEDINDALRAEGISAYRHDGGDLAGVPHGKSNHLVVLDDSKIKKVGSAAPDRSVVHQPTKADANQLAKAEADPKNNLLYDAEADAKFKDALENPVENQKVADSLKEEDELMETLSEFEKISDDPQIKKDIEEIMLAKKDANTFDKIYKSAIVCVGGR